MLKPTLSRSGEKGFTLVELAIVMIIIGLLIGGILKGQELIANARLASAVSKVKAIDAAINTFRDSYSGLPGDLASAATRIPNCTTTTRCGAATAGGTIGNSLISDGANDPGGKQDINSEMMVAWAQLSAADMLGGVQNTASANTAAAGGTTNPAAEVPGMIEIGYSDGTTAMTGYPATGVAGLKQRAGHYLLIHNGAGAGAVKADPATTVSLTANQASRIDIKLDDGAPNSGSVLAMGAVSSTTGCEDVASSAGVYSTANQAVACGVFIRIQQ